MKTYFLTHIMSDGFSEKNTLVVRISSLTDLKWVAGLRLCYTFLFTSQNKQKYFLIKECNNI